MPETVPSNQTDVKESTAPLAVITESYADEDTGALWLHKDLVQVRGDWETEAHIGPVNGNFAVGDVESFAAYLQRYADPFTTLVWWTEHGFVATLDHHTRAAPGRMTWNVSHPFIKSPALLAWERFARGQAWPQKDAIENLVDLGEDIVEPVQADLLSLLRTLRGNAQASASQELRPDGTSALTFSSDRTLRAGTDGTAVLPAQLAIEIPILVGRPDRFRLFVRVRADVDASAHLALRFSLANLQRTLETVYQEQVDTARGLLGEDYPILRGV